MSFTHLHVHTDYSVDGIAKIPALFKEAGRLGQPGLAITDHGTLAGVPEFLYEAQQHPDIKPVVGCEFYLERNRHLYHLILLAKNLKGYHNLVKLCSTARMGLNDARQRITHELLQQYHEDLICTSACIGGEIPQAILAGDYEKAKEIASWYKGLFRDDFYLEVSLHEGGPEVRLASSDNRDAYLRSNNKLVAKQKFACANILRLAAELGIKAIVTNDVHFISKDDAIAQDAFLCSSHNKHISDPDRIRYSHLEYLKNEEEMSAVFPDHPELISNTSEILSKVERYDISVKTQFPPMQHDSDEEFFDAVWAGAEKRFGKISREIDERIQLEISEIFNQGLKDYFLMMKEIVDRIRARGIAISPGRGASPSSIVCYCLGITEVDPVQFRLLSGRFIWKGRTTLPSIDLDIEDGRWDEAFSILSDMFGHDRVALIPVYKTKSIHSTALVVSKGNLSDYLPVKIAIGHPNEDYSLITQYELKWMEGSGAVPLNIISLHALQVLKKTIDLISDRKGEDVDLYSIPLDDAKTLALFASGNTSDIFMFQAKGMQKWLRDFAPDSFSDLVLLNTLYRPGLMDSLPLCLARKRGKEEAKYEIPGLKEIFAESYGVPVYQEQLMLAARLSGLDPYEDEDRKFMRLVIMKKKEEFLYLRNKFIEGGVEKGHPREAMESLYEWLLKEGHWAFNKSHSVSYTLLAFRSAWLKAHFPEEYARAYKENSAQ